MESATPFAYAGAPPLTGISIGVIPLAPASGAAVAFVRLNGVVNTAATFVPCSATASARARASPAADNAGSGPGSADFSPWRTRITVVAGDCACALGGAAASNAARPGASHLMDVIVE